MTKKNLFRTLFDKHFILSISFPILLFLTGNVVLGQKSVLFEDFETMTGNGSYSPGATVECATGSWFIKGYTQMDANDRRNGTRSVRLRGNATDEDHRIEMEFDKPGGAGTVSFMYGSYSGHSGGKLQLYLSSNQGATWVAYGDEIVAPSWVDGGSELQSASIDVNIAGLIRIKIQKISEAGSTSVNVDDIFITDFGDAEPYLLLTSPLNNAIFYSNNVDIVFTVGNFDLGTDGKVKYTVDSGTPQYVTSSPISLTGLSYNQHTVALELVNMDNTSLNPAVAVSVTFTCVVLQGNTYTLVKSMSDFEDGGTYLFVSIKNGINYGLGWQKDYNRHAVPVEVSGDKVITYPAAIVTPTQDEEFPYEIIISSENIKWTLFDPLNGKYLRPRTGESNNGLILNDLKAFWDFSIESSTNAVTLICTGSEDDEEYDRNTMRFNLNGTNPPLFSCYASGQQDFYIYKLTGSSIKQHGIGSDISVYPIPFDDILYFDNEKNIERVTVTNIMGQDVIDIKPSDNKIDTRTLSKGIYIVSFYSNEGLKVVKKVIKR
ncbi:MAG: T9SS type A sorting domain-containing protein [Marinilabiliaceae bacterium]|nr:T9SS type A sorting domain-containing protein [Marinilabiliaceae bacterium]